MNSIENLRRETQTRQVSSTQVNIILFAVRESIQRQLGGHCSPQILDTIQRALSCDDLGIDIQKLLAPRLAEIEEMASAMPRGAAPRCDERHVRFTEVDMESDEDDNEPEQADSELAEEDIEPTELDMVAEDCQFSNTTECVSNCPIAYANANFDGWASTQLSFNKGDLIEIIEWEPNSSWWVGRRDGLQGYVPCKFLQMCYSSACIDVQSAADLDLVAEMAEEAPDSHPSASIYQDEELHDHERVYQNDQVYEDERAHEDEEDCEDDQPPPPYEYQASYEGEHAQNWAQGGQHLSFCSGRIQKRWRILYTDRVCSCGWKLSGSTIPDTVFIDTPEDYCIHATGFVLAKSHLAGSIRSYGCRICEHTGVLSFDALIRHLGFDHTRRELLWTFGEEAFTRI